MAKKTTTTLVLKKRKQRLIKCWEPCFRNIHIVATIQPSVQTPLIQKSCLRSENCSGERERRARAAEEERLELLRQQQKQHGSEITQSSGSSSGSGSTPTTTSRPDKESERDDPTTQFRKPKRESKIAEKAAKTPGKKLAARGEAKAEEDFSSAPKSWTPPKPRSSRGRYI